MALMHALGSGPGFGHPAESVAERKASVYFSVSGCEYCFVSMRRHNVGT